MCVEDSVRRHRTAPEAKTRSIPVRLGFSCVRGVRVVVVFEVKSIPSLPSKNGGGGTVDGGGGGELGVRERVPWKTLGLAIILA